MKRMHCSLLIVVFAVALPGCRREAPPVNIREFPLTGQILSIKPDRAEARVKHDDVKGFMDAMTMDFTVKDPKELDGLQPGDLIAATLVITDEEGYLRGIRKTGAAPIAAGAGRHDGRRAGAPARRGGSRHHVRRRRRQAAAAVGLPRAVRPHHLHLHALPAARLLPAHEQVLRRAAEGDRRAAGAQGAGPAAVGFVRPRLRHAGTAEEDGGRRSAPIPRIWQFVTAPREAVDAFGARFGLSVIREGPNGQTITHNLRTPLVGRDGTLLKQYNGNDWSPDDVVRDLEGLVK